MDGNVTANPSTRLQDARLNIKTTVFAYSRSLGVRGRSGKFDIVLPEAHLAGAARVAGEPGDRLAVSLRRRKLNARELRPCHALPLSQLAEVWLSTATVGARPSLSEPIPIGRIER